MATSNDTPQKYRADPRPYEQKAWLYEHYWGNLRSAQDIADQFDGVSQRRISGLLAEHGIPRRLPGYGPRTKQSPFRGFYEAGDTNVDGTILPAHARDSPDWRHEDGNE